MTNKLRAKRIAEGLCGYCGKNPKAKNKTACQDCLDKKKANAKKHRDKKRESGICLDCDKPALEGYSRCEQHLRNHAEQITEKRKILLNEYNFCVDCGREPKLEGYSSCKKCIEKNSKSGINWGIVYDNNSQKEIWVKNDLRGRQFGALNVVDYSHKSVVNHFWLCSCECGNMHIAQHSNLLSGQVYSCGCINKPSAKEVRQERIKKGICTKCGIRPLVPDKTMCQKCLDHKREYATRVREEKKVKGICRYCSNPVLEGKTICQKCQTHHAEYLKERRTIKKELNICIDCLEPAEEGHIYCSYHLGLKRFNKIISKER